MAYVPTTCAVFWPDTAASIPANWTRATSCDEKYLSGSTVSAWGGTGGGSHTHTTSHTHTMGSHNHTLVITGGSTGTSNFNSGGNDGVPDGHTHTNSVTYSTVPTCQSNGPTPPSVTAHPPYMKVILIQPDTATQDVPHGAAILYGGTAAQFAAHGWGNFSLATGVGGTVDLDDCFLLGADAAGDGGGTGGSATHDHGSIPDHTHTLDAHTHSTSYFGPASSVSAKVGSGLLMGEIPRAHHKASNIQSVVSTIQDGSSSLDAISSTPDYVRLTPLQNVNGSDETVPYYAYLQLLADDTAIPTGWSKADGTGGTWDLVGKQVMCDTDAYADGSGLGSTNHTHTGSSHGHTGNSHDHTYTFSLQSPVTVGFGGTTFASALHSHTTHDLQTGVASATANTYTAASEDVRAPYKEIHWVALIPPEGNAPVAMYHRRRRAVG